jgi:hypothetical protein
MRCSTLGGGGLTIPRGRGRSAQGYEILSVIPRITSINNYNSSRRRSMSKTGARSAYRNQPEASLLNRHSLQNEEEGKLCLLILLACRC